MVFQGKRLPETRGDGFVAYEPENFAAYEHSGASWVGRSLEYIALAGAMPHAPLDPKVRALIESAWKHAKPIDGAQRGPIAAGGHRTLPQQPAQPPQRGPVAIGAHRTPQLPPRGPVQIGGHRTPPQLPPRGPVQIGGHRAQPPQMPPLPARPPVHEVQTYREAAPVQFRAVGQAPHLADIVPRDWKLMNDIPRVSAYGFRGDTRGPDAIRSANGFHPPITRSDEHYVTNCIYPTFRAYLQIKLQIDVTLEDVRRMVAQALPTPQERLVFSYYAMWRSQIANESMHLGRMIAQEDMKGYISTSRAVQVAKGFARDNGTVYVMHVNGGFLIPSAGTHAWSTLFEEQEIASPFAITWNDVVGYRRLDAGRRFSGPVYLRPDLAARDPGAFFHILELMSGRPQ